MSKKKAIKRTGIILISIIVVLSISWQLLKEFKIENFVVDTLQTELNNYFEDSVQFQMEGIRFQFLQKEIVLEDVKVILIGDQADTIANLSLSKLSFSWANLVESYTSQIYKFNSIELQDAKILLPLDFAKIKTVKASKPSFEGKFELQVDEFLMEDGEIVFYEERNEESGRVTAKYNIFAQDIHFEKGQIPKSLQDVAENISFEFTDLVYNLSDELHRLTIESVVFNLFEQEMTLISTHFRPIDSPEKFAELKKDQASYINIYLDSTRLHKIDWQGDSGISIQTVFTDSVNLEVIKDKNYPLPDDRFIPIIVELLKKSEVSIDVRKFIVQNMNLIYFEIPDGKEERGNVSITNIEGVIDNITNRKDSISKYGDYLVIDASGNLYDEGLLKAYIQYDLTSDYGFFKVQGSLQPMEMSHINKYLGNAFPIEIAGGLIDGLYFNYSGGNTAVSGEMEFRYTGLNIKFNKILNDDEKGDKALSWLANIALSQENPRKNGKYRIGKIEFERDVRKSMFSYWTNSLLSGFQSTIGINKPSRVEKLEAGKEDKTFWQKIGLGTDDK